MSPRNPRCSFFSRFPPASCIAPNRPQGRTMRCASIHCQSAPRCFTGRAVGIGRVASGRRSRPQFKQRRANGHRSPQIQPPRINNLLRHRGQSMNSRSTNPPMVVKKPIVRTPYEMAPLTDELPPKNHAGSTSTTAAPHILTPAASAISRCRREILHRKAFTTSTSALIAAHSYHMEANERDRPKRWDPRAFGESLRRRLCYRGLLASDRSCILLDPVGHQLSMPPTILSTS
jgi:hypothetical protein